MMHNRFSMYGMMWSVPLCGMPAHNTAANWLSWPLPVTPIAPLLVWSRRNGITEQRLCWQKLKQHWAQGWPLTFHLLPTSPKPGNTGRKQGHPDESVFQRAEGIESGFRVRGKKNWGGKNLQREDQRGCWHSCCDIERKTFSNLQACWMNQACQPVGSQLKSPPGELNELLSFLFEI